MATPDPGQTRPLHEGYQPLLDRGYQPTVKGPAAPDGTAGYQPNVGPSNVNPKPPSGGTSIQPPPRSDPAKK